MRTARPLGLSPDGRNLIVVTDGGEQVAIPADDRLRAALRNDRARMGQLEIEMESALRPRDIQARIRSGESLEAVAQAAGVPPEQIEPFAAPVIAEREHIAGLAQANPVRRAGDAVAHRSLRAVVTDRLLSRGVDADAIDWDAWRSGERRWTVRLSYESGSSHRQADFEYDQTGRFSVAANEDARWLTGEHSTSHGPQPGRKRRADEPNDDETLDLNDELAIVRAIQPQFAVTPDIDDDEDGLPDEDDGTPDNEDAFAEGDLAEVDGVYDIVPGDRSNMDVLYDMLSGFDEDSVQIYSGLVRPDPEAEPAPALDNGPEHPDVVVVETVDVIEIDADDEPTFTDVDAGDDEDELFEQAHIERSPLAGEHQRADLLDEDDLDETSFVEPVADPAVAALLDTGGGESGSATAPDAPGSPDDTSDPAPTEPAEEAAAQDAGHDDAGEAPAKPAPGKRPGGGKRSAAAPVVAEPEQPSLVEEASNEPSRPIKRKRASVPSWDEIMFGAPTPKPKE